MRTLIQDGMVAVWKKVLRAAAGRVNDLLARSFSKRDRSSTIKLLELGSYGTACSS